MSSITTSKNKRTAIDAGLPTTAGPPPKNRKLEERDELIEDEQKRAKEVQLEEEKKGAEEKFTKKPVEKEALEVNKKKGKHIFDNSSIIHQQSINSFEFNIGRVDAVGNCL